MTAYSIVTSHQRDPWFAAAELVQGLELTQLSGVIFFCSASYDLPHLAAALDHYFTDTLLVGCTTAGEITPEGYATGSIVALGFYQDFFHLNAALIQPLDGFALVEAQQLINRLLQSHPVQQTEQRHFALTLFDGLSSQEELVLAALDTALGGIPHFGGSAGDDIHLANTHVFYDGAFHNQAAVVLLVETALPFEVFSTHHMQPLDIKLVVTEADADTRRVQELNAEPAAAVYARLLGLTPEQLTPDIFALHPLAVKLGQDYYVRSIQRVNPDLSLDFYCAVGKGSVLTRMQPQAMLQDLEACLSDIESRVGHPLITLGCDCFLRRLEAEQRGEKELASAFLMRHRVIGFNTYGEHHAGLHINQTFTGVVLGRGEINQTGDD
ncbi:MAG: FIST C-terminal domain-containing protein [Marinospirillum sp.]|uniref:nitric oxide-sensing protein NosP n=1 Tax=Marinospirillum sp. TaxID=2183934 RepID=UPI001A0B6296|nr:nitric oxide-sensing protein NosP [Marinospirillum sp.]MBE0505931.1 FIST C-terminal domain-containing protein [Marinospirillum sp.]